MNKWELEFWESELGDCPVKDFLEELKRKDNLSHERINKKIDKLLGWGIADLCKIGYLEKIKSEGLYEFKISVSGIEFRFLGKIDIKNPYLRTFLTLCVAHAIKKKTNKLKNKDIEIAMSRLNLKK
jgi:phage-related protein